MLSELGILLSVRGTSAAVNKINLFSGSVTRAKHAVGDFATKLVVNKDALAAYSVATGVAAAASIYLASKLKSALGSSAEAARRFELELANLQYAASLSVPELEAVEKAAINMGTSSIYSADKVAKAWYNLASAGLQGTVTVMGKAGDETKSLAELALSATLNYSTLTRGMVDLDKAADTTVSLVNKLGVSFETAKWNGKSFSTELDRVYDKIAAVSRLTKMKPEEIPTILDSLRAAPQLSGSTVSEILALTAALQQMGYSQAEAAQHINAMVRSRLMMGGKYLQGDMYAKIRATMPHTRTGGGSDLRGKRASFFINEVFGSRAEFEKASKDAQGDFTSMLDFLTKIEKKVKAKGLGQKDTADLMLKFFGSSAVMSDYMLLSKSYKFFDEKSKKVFEGFEALKKLSDAIEDSKGEAEKYADAMARTAWGIKQTKEAALETFRIVFGQTVLPILNVFLRVLTSILRALALWLKENPLLAQAIGILTIAFTGLLAVLGGVLGIMILSAFSVAKFRAGYASVARTIADLTGKLSILSKAEKARLAAQTGHVFTPGTWLGNAAGKMRNFFSVANGGLLGLVGRFSIVIAVVSGFVEQIQTIKENIEGIKAAFNNVFKSMTSIWDWLVIKFRQIRVVLMALFTGEIYAEDVVELGEQFDSVYNFLASDFGGVLRNIALIINDIVNISTEVNKAWSSQKKDMKDWGLIDLFRLLYDLMPMLGKAMLFPLQLLLNWEEFVFKAGKYIELFPSYFEKISLRLRKIWDGLIVVLKQNFLRFLIGLTSGALTMMIPGLGGVIGASLFEMSGLTDSIVRAFENAFPGITGFIAKVGGLLGQTIADSIKVGIMNVALPGSGMVKWLVDNAIAKKGSTPDIRSMVSQTDFYSPYWQDVFGGNKRAMQSMSDMSKRLSYVKEGNTHVFNLSGELTGGFTEDILKQMLKALLESRGIDATNVTVRKAK